MSEFDSDDLREIDARLRRQGEDARAVRGACPPPDLLLARRSEALDGDVRAHLDRHVAGCAACRRLVDDVSSLGLDEPDADAESRVRARIGGLPAGRFPTWLPLAAAIAMTVGLAATWWYTRSRTATPAPAIAARPEPAAQPAPPAPVALWTIVAPPVRVPLSSLGETRSGEARADGLTLVAALTPFRAGDYAVAASRLEEVVKEAPASGEAQFYLGVAHLLAGRADAAIAPLERAGQLLPAARRSEAEWYLATAEQRTGRTGAARARLHAVCAAPGDYQAQACAAEAALK